MELIMELADEGTAYYGSERRTQTDRQLFVKNLGILLKQTREGILGCTLDAQDYVHIQFARGPERVVNVHMDSYTGIIRDVLRHI